MARPWYRQLHWQIFLAMGLGIAAGWFGGEPLVAKTEWMGRLFVTLLKMVIVPLVITSIVTGVASAAGGVASPLSATAASASGTSAKAPTQSAAWRLSAPTDRSRARNRLGAEAWTAP